MGSTEDVSRKKVGREKLMAEAAEFLDGLEMSGVDFPGPSVRVLSIICWFNITGTHNREKQNKEALTSVKVSSFLLPLGKWIKNRGVT